MLVTVYIPTHNRSALVTAAVESVLGQTHADLEVIVVDDNSTDDTSAVMERFCATDKRVKYVRNDHNMGAPASRNRAIEAAEGAFVTGLDDDDTFEPYRIAAFAESWKMLASYGMTPSCLFSQDQLIVKGEVTYVTSKPGNVAYDALYRRNEIGNQIFAPKPHFVQAGLFDTSMPAWQDLDLFIRVLKKFGPAHLVDVPSYRMDVAPRTDRISSNHHKVREACRRLLSKCDTATGRQELQLQQFGAHYGIVPNFSDLRSLMADDMSITSFAELAKCWRRNRR